MRTHRSSKAKNRKSENKQKPLKNKVYNLWNMNDRQSDKTMYRLDAYVS